MILLQEREAEMRNGGWLGFQLFLRPAAAQPFMHLNGVSNQLPFVLKVNPPKVGFLSLATKYSGNVDANYTTAR